MVGETPPQDESGEPRRGRRAASDPESSANEVATPARGSRASREARAAARSADPTDPDRRQAKERERLRAERERRRAEVAPGSDAVGTSSDDPDDTATHTAIAGRRRAPKLIIGVAAAVVLVLGVVAAVVALRGDDGPVADPDPTTSTTTSGPTALLSATSMLSTAQAKQLDRSRNWKVALDQTGRDESSPAAACVASTPVDGQPQPEQLLLRTLAASAAPTEAVLHQAQAYATPEQAVQAYTLIVKGFGQCVMAGTYISAGTTASGVGDQLSVLTFTTVATTTQFRTVAVNRTGRVVNILDVAKDGAPVSATRVVAALGQPTNQQCTAAIGLCTSVIDVQPGPPPVGGDQPGFLASADLPPAGSAEKPASIGDGQWEGLKPGVPAPQNSGCEAVDFSATPATARAARTYLWSATPAKSAFGLDENVLTLASAKDATALAAKVTKNIRDCKKRQLTATTGEIEQIAGVGAKQAKISGSVADVAQKTGRTTLHYRVAIVATGTKVVYLFLPTETNLDITDPQWQTLAIRAAQRATQTP